jgi:hypothetical protein
MRIFTPNTVISSADANLNFADIQSGTAFSDFVMPKIITAGSGVDTALTNGVYSHTLIPNTLVSVTPTINVTACIDGYVNFNKQATVAEETGVSLRYRVNGGAWDTLTFDYGDMYPTVSWISRRVLGTIDLTAGNTYDFQMGIQCAVGRNNIIRQRWVRLVTFKR